MKSIYCLYSTLFEIIWLKLVQDSNEEQCSEDQEDFVDPGTRG